MVAVLGVAHALPAQTVSGRQLSERFHLEHDFVERELGLVRKFVARGDEEHPVALSVRAARAALAAVGARGADVGLVIFAGVSRDYLPSWTAAVAVAGEIGAADALAYDVSFGCAGPLVAIDAAKRRDDARPPLSLVVSAERWSDTLSPDVPFPPALVAHADGGAACVLGPGSGLELGPLHVKLAPEFNDSVQIPAGGTRLPPSAATVAQNLHFRTSKRRAASEAIGAHYERGYAEVLTRAATDLGRRPADLDVVVLNQVRPGVRRRALASVGLPTERAVDTYGNIGHIGGADLFLGLERAQHDGLLAASAGVLVSSTLSAFVACSFRSADGGIAIPEDGGTPWTPAVSITV